MVEVRRPDNSRERFLSKRELERIGRPGREDVSEKDQVPQSDQSTDAADCIDRYLHRDALLRGSSPPLVVRVVPRRADCCESKVERGKERYVPMTSELAEEMRR